MDIAAEVRKADGAIGKANVRPSSRVGSSALFNLETLGDLRRMIANDFESRLCNIRDDDTVTGSQKLQARNKQKTLETSISFRWIFAAVGEPHGKDQL